MSESIPERAEKNFQSGLNCAQAVVNAFSTLVGVDAALLTRLASGLGGGLARQREVCGAVTGAALILGLKFGDDKNRVYEIVQEFSKRFKEETGSIVCRELLLGQTRVEVGGHAEERTREYYKKRPCAALVKLSAQIVQDLAFPS